MTKLSFEETLVEVWRRALAENAKAIEVDGRRYLLDVRDLDDWIERRKISAHP